MENKIKINVQVEVKTIEKVEKEISIPFYSKTDNHEYYKVTGLGDYETYKVRWIPLKTSYTAIDNGFNLDKAISSTEITQEEYDFAFNEAQKLLLIQNIASMENIHFSVPLINFIEKFIETLNVDDATSHVYWSKFLDFVKNQEYKFVAQDIETKTQ